MRDMNVKRVVVDSVSQFRNLSRDPVELRSYYNRLVNGLRREGVSALLLSEDGGPDLPAGDRGRLAFIVDAIILLRYVEIDSVMQRAIAVLKTRGSDHDQAIRRFEIRREGAVVGEPFAGREALLTGTARRTA
jgi:circadian clock protein KaiC